MKINIILITIFYFLPYIYSQNFYDCPASSSYMTIDTSLADTTDTSSSLPPGCKCKENVADNTECTRYECECICDLTAGACDLNCCCDSECTNSQIAHFEDNGLCVDEGPVASVITECYSDSELDEINPKYPITIKRTADDALDDFLCVESANTDFETEYYTNVDPRSLTDDDVKDYQYDSFDDVGDNLIGDELYDLNEFISVSNGDGDPTFGGWMSLPSPGYDQQCNENNYAKFMNPVSSNQCLRNINNIEEQCTELFDTSRFLQDLLIKASPISAGSIDDYLTITISNISYIDLTDGTTSLFENYNCPTYYGTQNSSLATNSPTLSPTTASPTTTPSPTPAGTLSPSLSPTTASPTPTPTIGECSVHSSSTLSDTDVGCRNALISICYTITTARDGTIESIEAELTVTDLPSTMIGLIEQSFIIKWVGFQTTTRNGNNIVDRIRSGNPGYLVGYPLLGGKLNSDTITPRSTGFQIDASSAFLSTATPLFNTPYSGETTSLISASSISNSCKDMNTTFTVGFGIDIFTGCTLELTEAELETICGTDGAKEYLTIYDEYIGIYGNADPLVTEEWLQIEESSGTSQSWDATERSCPSIISGLHYRVLTTNVGSKDNAQNKVLGVEATWKTSEWKWRSESSDTQTFTIATTVTYVHLSDEELENYIPPKPPVFFSVPEDIFYPFDLNSAGSRHHFGFTWVTVLIVGIMSIFLSIDRN